MTIMLAVSCIAVAESAHSPDIQMDSLRRWPRDFKGVAVVPTAVRHIESEAFAQCKGLTGVKFPESLETIGSLAFSGCDRLGEVNVPASVTNIGRSAFFNCRTLTNVVIRAKIRMLPDNLCSLCFGLSMSSFLMVCPKLATWPFGAVVRFTTSTSPVR